MKKYLLLVLSIVLIAGSIGLVWAQEYEEQPEEYDTTGEKIPPKPAIEEKPAFKGFLVYEDKTTFGNHYAPSGWMGDYTDLKLDYGYNKEPHAGKTCIRIEYNVRESQRAGWAGIFWQNPSGNWGEKKGGYNLTGATKLTFWARGEKGNEKIKSFKVGGISGTYPDSCSVSRGPVILKREWRQFTIKLKNRDLSYISGGFCWVAVAGDNPAGIVFYLDDIKFE
ncbi:MAG: hypothetical protein HY920_02465 [Elusimicrobia bacterium]|nr:hypothetical protein [Elusimicrobiota bacterium]